MPAVDSGGAALDWRARLERERTFLGTSALVFLASAGVTIDTCKSMSGGMTMPGGWTMSMAWMRVAGQTWLAAATTFMGTWVVMMVAMMLPSLVPMLMCYRRAIRGQADSVLGRLTTIAAGGYFFVWAIVGMVAYPIGVSWSAAEMRSLALQRFGPLATGILLLLAGSIQLTPWKTRRLMRCRHAPVSAPASRAAPAAWKHGLCLGMDCSLCCVGLMIVLIVTGVMSLPNMVVVTAAITAERLACNPERIARVFGVVIIVSSLLVIARAVG
jgi:predicted metal-binding membrane protein